MAKGGVVTGQQGQQGGQQNNQPGAVQMVKSFAQSLMSLPPDNREAALARYEENYPEMGKMIRAHMKEIQKQNINMKPLPEQKPPRRKGSPV